MPYLHTKSKPMLQSVLSQMEKQIYTPISELRATAWVTPEPVPFEERETGKEETIAIGQSWGALWDCAWFHFQGQVPESAQGQEIVLLIDLSGEGCVFDADGNPILGLTTQSSVFAFELGQPGKRVVPFLERAVGNEGIDLWVEAGNNDLFGNYQDNGVLKEAHIAICNRPLFDLYHDFYVLHDLMTCLPEDSARYHSILVALAAVAQHLADGTPEDIQPLRDLLAPELAKQGGTPSLQISAIGHAHIDLAWLWPLRETIRKGARTFSTVLDMMERYPDYVFGASQPQLYQWMKDHYPALYERIKVKIAEGRWEPQGAMWVEPDTNVPSGEALIRQIIYGKRFFQQEFDMDIRVLWLPDVFGYSGALPQILKRANIDYFMTQKLSWNVFNTFPHHTFVWQGIDGSEVLAHMPPEGTYNSAAEPHSLLDTEQKYLDKGVSDGCLVLYGIGDGGGGPGTSHLEALKRERNLDGLPPVTQEWSATFFERLAQKMDRYKTWTGELYLERHQGTYTTQARNKRYNRKMEFALRELELWAALTGTSLPRQVVDAIWQEMLLYQFHDILPGSSITRVYEESVLRYEQMLGQVEQLTRDMLATFAQSLDTSSFNAPAWVSNSLSWERSEWLKVNEKWLHVTTPPMSYAVIEADAPSPVTSQPKATSTQLENDHYIVQFDELGALASIYDKTFEREVLSNTGNILAVYEDHGDAWDIPYTYRENTPARFTLTNSESVVDGPQAIMKQSWAFGASTLEQQIILTAGSRRIDFVTTVNWQEEHKMLRTSFPVTVRSNEAICDIQFGTISRPTHRNTSWDVARHEICAHKWLDLSQPDYGVALLNDCKYGYYVEPSLLDLNLLRSPTYPDPVADRASHEFTYALYPHTGDHIVGSVMQAAYNLNVPLQAQSITSHDGSAASDAAYLTVDSPNIIVETIKPAENDQGLIIRLYESSGSSVKTSLNLNLSVVEAWLTDLTEATSDPLDINDQAIKLTFTPFEIKTIRIVLD